MPLASFLDYLVAAGVGSAVAAFLLFASARLFSRRRQTARELMGEAADRTAFLFDGEDLVDATPAARALLERCGKPGSDWARTMAVLSPSFPDLRRATASLREEQYVEVEGDGQRLEAEHWEGLVRLMLVADEAGGAMADGVTVAALEEELRTLRTLAEDSPQLIWRLDQEGDITWANRAYIDLAAALDTERNGPVATWPPIHVFDKVRGAPLHGEPTRRRVPVPVPVEARDGKRKGDDVDWYEVTSLRRGQGSVHFAADANGIVRAERVQREFVQTLTKTFADLSTGLMIFDRHRRLVLFNPAFLDMSELPIEFLSGRPVIQSVLDRLREARILPEPKDYTTWRDQMTALESAAKDGTYSENWTLPSGQTYRVTGRPHPDGAIAFLFEDISNEVSLTRRFRSELEFGQAVIDNIEEAVVVFAASGAQIAANQKYCTLWGVTSSDDDLAEVTIVDALATWRRQTAPTPIWRDLHDFVTERRDRAEWNDRVQMTDGRAVLCRFVPLSGGATMAAFRLQELANDATPAKDDQPRIALARIRG